MFLNTHTTQVKLSNFIGRDPVQVLTEGSRICVAIRLRQPPLLHLLDDDHDPLMSLLTGRSSGMLSWELDAESSNWELGNRAIDSTDCQAFGRCLLYRLYLPVASSALRPFLSDCFDAGLCRSSTLYPQPVLAAPSVYAKARSEAPEQTVDRSASSLDATVRLALCALCSSFRLDASGICPELVATLEGVSPAAATKALTFMTSELPVSRQDGLANPVSACVRALASVDEHADAEDAEDELDTVEEELLVRRVQCTPTRLLVHVPGMERSNRMLREHSKHLHRFVRVLFTDEYGGSLPPAAKAEELHKRVAMLVLI